MDVGGGRHDLLCHRLTWGWSADRVVGRRSVTVLGRRFLVHHHVIVTLRGAAMDLLLTIEFGARFVSPYLRLRIEALLAVVRVGAVLILLVKVLLLLLLLLLLLSGRIRVLGVIVIPPSPRCFRRHPRVFGGMIIVRHTFSAPVRNGGGMLVMITRWGVKMLMDTRMMVRMAAVSVVGLGSWDSHGRKRMAADAGSTAGVAVASATTATAAGNAPVGLTAGVERRLATLQVVHLDDCSACFGCGFGPAERRRGRGEARAERRTYVPYMYR